MKKTSFQSLSNINELIDYLEMKGKNHKNYYHYTNREGLRGMLLSKKMHISRGNQMNDKQELTKGNLKIWENLYLASFNYGEEENMAMWGLYGVPNEDAIRITIPGKYMRNWINDIGKIYSIASNRGETNNEELLNFNNIALTDVVYVTGKRNDDIFNLKRSGDKLTVSRENHLGRVSDHSKMTGYIKNAAWSYENEVRIRIVTKDVDYDQIAIDIPEDVINNMKLLFGPNYNACDNIDNSRFMKMEKEDSIFKGLVKYKEKCWFCDHEYKRRIL
jgi:hypothetical protein